MLELAGKTALVTGGARRIGREIVLALAGAGCNVVLHHHASPDAAAKTMQEAIALGVKAEIVTVDLRKPHAAEEIFAAVTGPVDLLVNNAASFEATSFDDVSVDAWDAELALNLRAPFFLCQAFVRQLSQAQPGAVVNVGDARMAHPGSDHPVYRLTKSALTTLTEDLALTLAPAVRVNEVALGSILPPPGEGPDHLERLRQQIPLARTGGITDVTEAVLFLLRSDFLTGVRIPIDGGQYL
ncbi:MAG: SDR family NAD(P)-dependent oxidoreductase [Planctomycetota bacterium]